MVYDFMGKLNLTFRTCQNSIFEYLKIFIDEFKLKFNELFHNLIIEMMKSIISMRPFEIALERIISKKE